MVENTILVEHSRKNMASYGFGKFLNEFIEMAFTSFYFFFYERAIGLQTELVFLAFIVYAIWNAINEARDMHGDKYDYSKSVYKGSDIKLIITCRIHGDFMQSPIMHIKGQGCPICGKEKSEEQRRKDPIIFVNEAKRVHKGKYDYSKVVYINNKVKVKIICPDHGVFLQRPDDHLKGSGCYICAADNRRASQRTSETVGKDSWVWSGNRHAHASGAQRSDRPQSGDHSITESLRHGRDETQ